MGKARLAVIGGTGFEDPALLGRPTQTQLVETRFGSASVSFYAIRGETVAFLSRHGPSHTVPPHGVNYRANIAALASIGVERVVSTAAVGSLRRELAPGTVVVVDQFLDFTRQRPFTFFDGDTPGACVVHTDFTEPYCPEVRARLLEAARSEKLAVRPSGCYVGLEGPRYESAAEVRAFAMLGGDVVGMTGLPEAVLAREAGLCFATVAVVTNLGAGLSGAPLSHREVEQAMASLRPRVLKIMLEAILALPAERHCPCANVPGRGLVR